MNKKLLWTLLLLLVLFPNALYAQAVIPEQVLDTYRQEGSALPTEHRTYAKWYTNSVFHHDDWDSSIYMVMSLWAESAEKPTAQQAMLNWQDVTYWPGRHLTQWKLTQNNADVDIYYGTCNSGLACASTVNYYIVNPRNTRVPQYWNITYNDSYLAETETTQRAIMSHEFGHVMGRGEAYSRDSSGNAHCETVILPSIMDAIGCDSTTPTTYDKQYNDLYWNAGYAVYQAASNVSGSHLQAWRDFAWNDGKHLLEWYYWSPSDSNYLNFYSTQYITPDSGSHHDVNLVYSNIDQYLSFAVVPSSYGVPYYTQIKLCVTPIMAGYPGTRACSPGVTYTP